MFCPLLNFAVCDRMPPSYLHLFVASFTNLTFFFLRKIVFACKLMEPSIEVVGASIGSRENFHGFDGNFRLFVISSTGFHQYPSTSGYSSAKSPYACISYHELQALPPLGREGRSFASIIDRRTCCSSGSSEQRGGHGAR